MVTCRLEPHDANQLELRLGYEVQGAQGKEAYVAEIYLFLPMSLGVTRSTYTQTRFYEDTSAFVRLRTPRVALTALGDAGQPSPWFDRVRDALGPVLAGRHVGSGTVVRGLKLLGCVYRGALRTRAAALAGRFDGFLELDLEARVSRAEALASDLALFPAQVAAALEQLRAMGHRCEQTAVPREISDAWRAVDELAAIVAEDALTSLVERVDAHADMPGAEALVATRDPLADAAVAQYHYRRGRGFESYIEPDMENEQFPYRRALLTRIVSSVLFLDVRHPESGRVTTNLVGAIAASLAMLFAVLCTIWATQRFDVASAAFILTAVGSYAVKDRIKEWGKRVLGRRAARFVPDRLIEICDKSTGAVLGTCAETVSIFDAHQAPAAVSELRHADHPEKVAAEGRPETVIRYTKQMALMADALGDALGDSRAVNDIVRFNLGHLRARMDAPYEAHRYVSPETGELLTALCARVYHVNLVLRLTRGRGRSAATDWERMRVVLDQRGIKRVEQVVRAQGGGVLRTVMPRSASVNAGG